jgi:hypothetical protein
MGSIVVYAIWASLIVMVLALVGLILFGIRSLIQGKISPLTAAIILIPAVLVGILGLILDSWASAGIWTMMIMIVLAALSLILSGARGLFS